MRRDLQMADAPREIELKFAMPAARVAETLGRSSRWRPRRRAR